MEETRKCAVCGKEKPTSEFSAAYKNKCKECRNAEVRAKRNAKHNHGIDWEARTFELVKVLLPGFLNQMPVANTLGDALNAVIDSSIFIARKTVEKMQTLQDGTQD